MQACRNCLQPGSSFDNKQTTGLRLCEAERRRKDEPDAQGARPIRSLPGEGEGSWWGDYKTMTFTGRELAWDAIAAQIDVATFSLRPPESCLHSKC